MASLARACEVVEPPVGEGDADDGDAERAAGYHAVEGREDELVGEVARRAEEDERVRLVE